MIKARNEMHIGIDLTSLLPISTGVDNYIIQLVRSLNKIDHKTLYSLFINYEDRKKFTGQLYDNFSIIPIAMRSRLIRFFAQQFLLPILAISLRIDVLHSPSFFMPLFRGNQRHLLTVHDMTMFSLPDYHTRFRRSCIFRIGVALSVKRSHLIIVSSHFVKKEIVRLLPDIEPDRIRVIPMGIGSQFNPQMIDMVDTLPIHLEGFLPYILFVGNIEPRKNLKLLIEGYQRAIKDYGLKEHLLIVGNKDWNYRYILKLSNHPEIRERVYFTGYVDDRTLTSLYKNATLFIYPSIEEGFGFPPLEAMACGIPTIATDTSSLRENLHGAAILVPSDDPEALRNAIIKMLRNKKIRKHFRRKGLERIKRFRWEEAALKTLACYEELSKIYHQQTL